MRCKAVRKAQKTHPTGDPKFSVMQAFPAAVSEVEADPFLMCDHFGPAVSTAKVTDPDEFPVDWHPHRGFDIMTYLIEGVGRHADSMGNRGEYASPGMQWISTGSGIEHAEVRQPFLALPSTCDRNEECPLLSLFAMLTLCVPPLWLRRLCRVAGRLLASPLPGSRCGLTCRVRGKTTTLGTARRRQRRYPC